MKHVVSASSILLAACLLCTAALAQDAQTAPTTTAEEAAAPAQEPVQEATPTTETSPEAADAPAPAPTPAQEGAETSAMAAAAPSDAAATPQSEKVTGAVGIPSAGKALVVFFRPSKFVGGAVGFKVRENEVELGKLRNGNYFAIEVEPGMHSYVVHSESKDVTTIEAEAGETYFLSGSISMGVMVGRPNLSPSNAGAFEAALPKLKKSKPLD